MSPAEERKPGSAGMEPVLRCAAARATPPFMPAIYEHKAWFIGATPTAISRDPALLTRALLAEFETIGPDALTVGVDIYNVEAEAIGCRVTFYEGNDPGVPGIKPGDHAIRLGDDLSSAPVPDPRRAGRMPVNVAAARAVRRELGEEIWVRGAVSGPFSLACALVGAEDLFMACYDDVAWVRSLLDYTTRVVKAYAAAYLDAGVGLAIFDSQASPELLSPAMFTALVEPAARGLVTWAQSQGVRDVPLIIGGNTTAIADALVRTGANNLLCDFPADFEIWSRAARASGRALRRNVSPRLIAAATPDQIHEVARDEVRRGRDLPGFILGTGVIPYGTATENVLAVRAACRAAAPA